jgi:hypothetical protein
MLVRQDSKGNVGLKARQAVSLDGWSGVAVCARRLFDLIRSTHPTEGDAARRHHGVRAFANSGPSPVAAGLPSFRHSRAASQRVPW